jgi:cell wall-associated NlpC family hydrolase
MEPDPRTTPWRPDLAAESLRGRVTAARYVPGEAARIVSPSTPVLESPEAGARRASEALQGERITVYERTGAWCWCQLARDGYVGYVAERALGPVDGPATHEVCVSATFAYATADIKAPVGAVLPLTARVRVAGQAGPFARVMDGGYIWADHLRAIGSAPARDFVAVAEQFVGVPYLWGGKTHAGLDCSGLVQISLQAADMECPRDSDMQRDALGEAADVGSGLERLRRGDLLFWPGHVAIAVSATQIIHANGHHMCTVVEPVTEAARRIAATGLPITVVKRLSSAGGAAYDQ